MVHVVAMDNPLSRTSSYSGSRRGSADLSTLDQTNATQQLTVSKKLGKIGVTLSNDEHGGVIVTHLLPGSQAAQVGLNVGDVILSVNGILCSDHRVAIQAIDDAPDTVAFVLKGLTHRAMVDKSTGKVGITCRNRTEKGRGVQVSNLVPGGSAQRAGIMVGDVLLSVGGTLVDHHEHAIELVDASETRFEMVLLGTTRCLVLNKMLGDVGVTFANNIRQEPGVVVVGLEPGKLAVQSGVQLGDVVLSINGQLVDSHGEAVQYLDAATAQVYLVLSSEKADISGVLSDMTTSCTNKH